MLSARWSKPVVMHEFRENDVIYKADTTGRIIRFCVVEVISEYAFRAVMITEEGSYGSEVYTFQGMRIEPFKKDNLVMKLLGKMSD